VVVVAQVRDNQLLPAPAVCRLHDATNTLDVVAVLQAVWVKFGEPLLPLTQVAASTNETTGATG
jgi:hypothetical protein